MWLVLPWLSSGCGLFLGVGIMCDEVSVGMIRCLSLQLRPVAGRRLMGCLRLAILVACVVVWSGGIGLSLRRLPSGRLTLERLRVFGVLDGVGRMIRLNASLGALPFCN